VLVQVGSDERCAALGRDSGEQPGLAARAGAQVKPEPVPAFGSGPGQGQDGELTRLVLNGRPAFGYGADCAWIAMIQVSAERGPPGGLGARGDELVAAGQPGHGSQRDRWPVLIGGERGLSPGQAPLGLRQAPLGLRQAPLGLRQARLGLR